MELIRDPIAIRELADGIRGASRSVALVPTMGALHAGHVSLIRRARKEADAVIVSIFVNPLQFGAGEDFERYPRDERADLSVCGSLGVDAVWAPTQEQMYPPGLALVEPDPGPVGDRFEGAVRPGHFAGVLTAVHRLLHVVGHCAGYFGEKDAQQLFLVRRMAASLALPAEIVGCPTVREPDGLACSSRNAYLSTAEREEAGSLFLGLSEAAELARGGERDPRVLVAAIAREVGAAPLATLDYAAVVDDATFDGVERLGGSVEARALVAARFGAVRLIDNLRLPMEAPVRMRD
jgi:pantoate--beta-alanine ligase